MLHILYLIQNIQNTGAKALLKKQGLTVPIAFSQNLFLFEGGNIPKPAKYAIVIVQTNFTGYSMKQSSAVRFPLKEKVDYLRSFNAAIDADSVVEDCTIEDSIFSDLKFSQV